MVDGLEVAKMAVLVKIAFVVLLLLVLFYRFFQGEAHRDIVPGSLVYRWSMLRASCAKLSASRPSEKLARAKNGHEPWAVSGDVAALCRGCRVKLWAKLPLPMCCLPEASDV